MARQSVNRGLYADGVLTVLAIAFLVLVLPWFGGIAVGMAYNSSPTQTDYFPSSLTAATEGVTWVSHTDNPNTQFTDCEPYDPTSGVVGSFPSTSYNLLARNLTLLHPTYDSSGGILTVAKEDLVWRHIGAPFGYTGTSPYCSTVNDEVGLRLDPSGSLMRVGTGHALTRFNASIIPFELHTIIPTNTTVMPFVEFDWRVELNGVTMFGESVRNGDPDASTKPFALWDYSTPPGGSPTTIVVMTLDHTLNPEEERRVRDTLATANASTLNLTVFVKCINNIPIPGYELCEMRQTQTGSGHSPYVDWWIHAETEWVEADDYDLVIQGAAFLLSVACLTIAVAATPLWNPLKQHLGGAY